MANDEKAMLGQERMETALDHEYSEAEERRFGSPELIASALSAVWIVFVAVFFLVIPTEEGSGGFDPFTFVMILTAVFMPVALIWVGASAAKSTRIIRAETSRLQSSVDAMRSAYVQGQQTITNVSNVAVEKKLDEIANAQRQTETALEALRASSGFAPELPANLKSALPRGQVVPDGQPSLALGTPAEALEQPISVEDFIRAIHFPESEDDQLGFNALRVALRDPGVAGLVRSAQDVLTLLSEDGIYMDDLIPDRARPEIWRRFAKGERGGVVADLGGVRDRSSLALAAGRMKQDPIFRDAVHHFLRKFDKTLSEFAEVASDSDMAALAETRTARAFMLLGRVSGTFD
ncbi:hypothetical protein [Actibacterium sp. 188UL27-1]|uniref:hypothetical protein n=1 Tax=Actibacterium sp. 188UL27-1 TaxID=2786961 RepID=UPI001958747E|nr:hypothetical protein [Actibacterium sp. 188UL27-1]MBM7068534.1 hypothetical protein [Actibacterium sp. 188UL27-1]